MTFTGKEEHHITLEEAIQYTKNYRAAKPSAVKGGFFGRGIFEEILAQKDCAGIRCYYGLKDDASPVLVLVGVNSAGEDMVDGTIADIYIPCPPVCNVTSPLV